MELIKKESVVNAIANLVRYGIEKLSLNELDGIYAHNQLIELFQIEEPNAIPETFEGDLYRDILDVLCGYACQENMIEKHEVERFKAKVMGYVLPSPSAVVDKFDSITATAGIRKATMWLYGISTDSAYINMPAISKNLSWKYPGKDGDLIVTINTSRPEKDPKEIALAAKSKQTNYPKCMLCVENIGYAGRINHPARQNLRFIPIPLNDDSIWYMQFSPYRYFNEHCIFFNEKHEPMTLGEKSFARMVELVRNVPHYFVGSNAPLPIVGGSILAHDHYQGGAKEMPVFKAKPKVQYYHPNFPGVKFSIVNWYNSLIRIKCDNDEQFVKAMTYVNDCWAKYSDEKNGIIASSYAQHNAITPVVHLERGELYAELFLRNNRTDSEHPFGIFHPTEDLHHIKKEGIGVIEVMGTFILPGRLASYITQIRKLVSRMEKYDEEAIANPSHPLYGFRNIIKLLMRDYDRNTLAKADTVLLRYISERCEDVIRSTAVFKSTSDGYLGFQAFMRSMGMENSEFKDNNHRQYLAQKRNESKNYVNKGIPIVAGPEDPVLKNIDKEPIQENVTLVDEIKNEVSDAQGDVATVNETPLDAQINAPKKRGRKSNAEKERLRQLEEMNAKNNLESNQENVGDSETAETSNVQTSESAEPVKRKRGRPRKNA